MNRRAALGLGLGLGVGLAAAARRARAGVPDRPASGQTKDRIMEFKVTAVPDRVRAAFKLAPFYQKYLDARGLPVLSSARVSDYALFEAGYVVDCVLRNRQEVLDAISGLKIRLAVMAADEVTTDIPEHSDLTPKKFWDRRARGLGATRQRPCVSCGEENLLNYRGDPYREENILIHEFGHVIHELGMSVLDPTFDKRLEASFQAARAQGLWDKTYAGTNRNEYFANGLQAWFDCARTNSPQHNQVGTREALVKYDPGLAGLLREAVGDSPWRYVRPDRRAQPEHLKGFDRSKAPEFKWDPELQAWYDEYSKRKT